MDDKQILDSLCKKLDSQIKNELLAEQMKKKWVAAATTQKLKKTLKF